MHPCVYGGASVGSAALSSPTTSGFESRRLPPFFLLFLFPELFSAPAFTDFLATTHRASFSGSLTGMGFTSFACFHPFRALFDPAAATTVGGSHQGWDRVGTPKG